MVNLDTNEVKCRPLETQFPPKERKKLLEHLRPIAAAYRRRKGQADLMLGLDVAFYNAPPPEDADDSAPVAH